MPIRPATPDDAPAIAHVHTESWRVAYRGIMPDGVLDRLSEEESAARWRARLVEPRHGTLVAERADCVVGFTNAGPSRDGDASTVTGELLALYVAPQMWGRGIGHDLWQASRSTLAEDGYAEATVWVLKANTRARRFYERVGFVLEPAKTKIAERDGVSLVLIRYRLRLI